RLKRLEVRAKPERPASARGGQDATQVSAAVPPKLCRFAIIGISLSARRQRDLPLKDTAEIATASHNAQERRLLVRYVSAYGSYPTGVAIMKPSSAIEGATRMSWEGCWRTRLLRPCH